MEQNLMAAKSKKLCLGRTIGVYLSNDRISITEAGLTFKGPGLLGQHSFNIDQLNPLGSLADTLKDYVKKVSKNTPLCLGLRPEQTFFITAGAEYEQQEDVRDKLLEAVGFHSAEERNDIVADYFKINKSKSLSGQFWSISVCKKKLVDELYAAFAQAGFKNVQLKPTPWCISVFSAKLPKHLKHWKVFIQVFLNDSGGLAILVIDRNPVYFKRFSFSPTTSVEEIESAVRSIMIQCIVIFRKSAVDGIIVQGPDAEKIGSRLAGETGLEVEAGNEVGFTGSLCSGSLAMSAKSKKDPQFDLFREVRPKPGILQMFPWKMAAFVVFLSGCLGLMLWQKASDLNLTLKNLKQQNSMHTWAENKQTADIAKDKKPLLAETQAIEKFLKSKIVWSDYLRDLPTRLPPNVSLSDLWAVCEFEEIGVKKMEGGTTQKKKLLSLRGITLFEKGKAAPEAIESFLESLRKVELLQRDFPQVQLAEIKWRREGNSETAMFTVLAMPKKSAEGKPAQDEKSANSESEG